MLIKTFCVQSFKSLVLFASFLSMTNCLGQNQWITYNSTNSTLPNAIMSRVAKDASGNLWIATGGSGLVKFDGTSFTTYDGNNSPLPHNICTAIATEGNIIWIGTVSGMAKLDGNSWTVYNIGSGLPCNLIRDIIVDSNGYKWIGSLCGPPANQGGGLTKFDGVNWTTYNDSNSSIVNNFVTSISEDNQGNIWTAHSEYFGGVSRFDGINWTIYDTSNSALPTNDLNNISTNPFNNEVWVGSSQGAFQFNGTVWTIYNANNSGMVTDQVTAKIKFDDLGNTWIGTQLGMTIMSSNTSWNTYNNLNSGIPSPNVIYDVIVDSVSWIATGGNLVRLDGIISIPKTIGELKHLIKVYPNPSSGVFNLITPVDFEKENCVIMLYNLQGEMLNKTQFTGSSTQFDFQHLSPGMYFYKILKKGSLIQTGKICII